MRATALASVAFALALVCSAAQAAEPGHRILAYGKVGGLIPVSKLGPHVSFRLGGGYVPPILQGRLALLLDLGYSQTSSEDTIDDPRLGESGGAFSYTLTQRDLNLFVGPQYFFLDPDFWIVPYAALGLDLHFLQSSIEGEGAGEALGENREVSTKAGVAVRAGAGYGLGPGMLTGELTFAWAPIDHAITGDSHLGRLAILVGYTAIFGF